jgi:hypothetical protein
VEHVERMVGNRETYKLLAIRPETGRLLHKLSERCENNIQKDFQTLNWRGRSELIWLLVRTRGGLLWTW